MKNDTRLKRLIYQSWHRGCKETDFLLGNFAKKYLHEFTDEELDIYEEFINEDDWDIYAWLTSKTPLPESHKNKITDKIIHYALNENKDDI